MNKTTPEIIAYREFIQDIIDNFCKRRITKFAKTKSVDNSLIHAHNDTPIWAMIKQFKSDNSIKTRSFKTLSDAQKEAWRTYYTSHMKLVLMTDDEHKKYHSENEFVYKTNLWNRHETVEDLTEQIQSEENTKKSASKQIDVKPTPINKNIEKSKLKSVNRLSEKKSIKTDDIETVADVDVTENTLKQPLQMKKPKKSTSNKPKSIVGRKRDKKQ